VEAREKEVEVKVEVEVETGEGLRMEDGGLRTRVGTISDCRLQIADCKMSRGRKTGGRRMED
jgi:hypothetical protein